MATKSIVICGFCKKEFEKENRYINRAKKRNPNALTFCSRSCCSYHNMKVHPEFKLNLKNGRENDIYSQFKKHFLNAKNRATKNNIEFTITWNDLKFIWDKQNGKCAYTDIKLLNSKNSSNKLLKSPIKASLDRIDSSKGYTPDNIQWVSLICQYAKNSFTENQLKEFIETLKNT